MVVNYKGKPQKFNLYTIIPKEAIVGNVEPKPDKITENKTKVNNILFKLFIKKSHLKQ